LRATRVEATVTFEAAQTYLLGTINETVSRRSPARLDRMRRLLSELGDPQRSYPTFHVGGTSGKGSTSTMIAAALSAAGRRIGLHTKPHLVSMVERAAVDGVAVSEERFGALLEEMMPAIECTARDFGRPTYYETLLALAFAYFAERRVDAAVIEVGIGGKLDGTNVLHPVVSAITNVGLDHTDVLGETVEEIARDKSGIAKAGVPLVSDATGPGRAIIEEACRSVGAPYVPVAEATRVTAEPSVPYGQAFTVETSAARYDIELPVLGAFQQRNAATAIAALEAAPAELRPTPGDVVRGLARLVIPGRMEFFPGHPPVVFDIAHNADKARSLAESLAMEFPGRRITFVIAVGEGKDARGVLAPFLAMPGSLVFTSFSAAGRTPARLERLEAIAREHGRWSRRIEDPIEALQLARRGGDATSIVVVTGSTFLVAALRDWWLSNVGTATLR
jgi:dihydrofolate synthase / folylpolyglutamate synthase